MKIEMRGEQHLWVVFDPPSDNREVIIDKARDVRVTDHQTIVKIAFDPGGSIAGVLVDDIFVWQHRKAGGHEKAP